MRHHVHPETGATRRGLAQAGHPVAILAIAALCGALLLTALGFGSSLAADRASTQPQGVLAIPGVDVAITKTVTSAQVEPGARITFTLDFANLGDSPAGTVVVTDILPAGLTNLSIQASGNVSTYAAGPPNWVWQFPGLASEESDVIVIGATISPGVVRGTVLTNTAQISAVGDVDSGNNQSAVTITVLDLPIVGLTATSDSPTLLGGTTNFTASVTSGTSVAYAWDFGDGNTGSGANPAHSYAAPGSYTAVVTATNNVSGSSTSTGVVVVSPDVGIAKTVQPTQIWPGAVVTYTITYSNAGTAPATGVVITDIVPAEIISPSVLAAGAQITDTGALPPYVWQVADLAPSAGGTIVITGMLDANAVVGSVVTNTAEIAAASDWDPADRTSSVVFTIVDQPIVGLAAINDSPTMLGSSTQFTAAVVAGTNVSFTWAYGDGDTGAGATSAHTYAAPGSYTAIVTATNSTNSIAITTPVTILAADVGIAKRVSNPLPPPEAAITYTLVYSNAGNTTAANVRITDTLPVEVTDVVVYVSGSTVIIDNNPEYILDVGSLAPGAGGTIVITAKLRPGLAVGDIFTNTATIGTATVEAGPRPNTSSAVVAVGDAPITGLTATNDGPTLLSTSTQLTATVATGTNPTYEWDFGDGHIGAGPSPVHLYSRPGTFTAVVTATNNTSFQVATTVVEVKSAELVLTKDVRPAIIGPGDPVTFTLTFTNAGSAVASGLRLTDTFPAGIDNVTISVNGVAVNLTGFGPTYIWDLADMAPGAVGIISLRGTVNSQTPTGTILLNSASINTTTPESDKSDNTASASAQVALTPIENLSGAVTGYAGIVPRTGEILTFIASVQSGTAVSYSWDFGDGSVTAAGSGQSALHAYARPGIYQVTVTATNVLGSTAYTFPVMVTEDGNPAYYGFLPAIRK